MAKRDRVAYLKKQLEEMVEDCKHFIQNLACNHSGSVLTEVLRVDEKVLDLYIQEHKIFKSRVKMAKARLAGEDITTNPKFVMQSLYDCSFEYEDYKSIGENDGILKAVRYIYEHVLGMYKKAYECTTWMYNGD